MKFHEMTSSRLALVDRDKTLVIVPIAAVEQHGPHLPTGTDSIICGAVTDAVEAKMSDEVLLIPTQWLGASAHHLRFGATLDCELSVYISMLNSLVRSLMLDGFMRLLFVNGHGGNVDPMRVALRQLQSAYPKSLLAGGSYWSVAEEFIGQQLDGEHKRMGHACEIETSLIMHLRPELVDRDELAVAGQLVTDNIDGIFLSRDMRQRTRNGYSGRPDLATAGKGKQIFNGIVDHLMATVTKLLAERLGSEYQSLAR